MASKRTMFCQNKMLLYKSLKRKNLSRSIETVSLVFDSISAFTGLFVKILIVLAFKFLLFSATAPAVWCSTLYHASEIWCIESGCLGIRVDMY